MPLLAKVNLLRVNMRHIKERDYLARLLALNQILPAGPDITYTEKHER